MKKMAVILVVTFFTSLGATIYATNVVLENGTKITVIENDKKPCPAGCTCDNCKAKAETANTTNANTTTDDKKSADCSKKCGETKKSCCSKATETKSETKAETTGSEKK